MGDAPRIGSTTCFAHVKYSARRSSDQSTGGDWLMSRTWRGVRILDRVVQERGSQDPGVGDSGLIGEHIGHGDRMVDIGAGFRALAALVAVLIGGESARSKDD